MAFRKQLIVLMGFLVVLTTPSFAQDSRARILEITRQAQHQQLIIDELRIELAEKTSDLEKTKKSSGIVSKLVLQKKMREAQTVSKDLENVVKAHDQLSHELRKERSKLLAEIDQELQTLTLDKNSRKLTDLQKFQKLISEKDQILALQQQSLLDVPEFNLSSTANNKEDLIEKLQVVEDLQKNIRNKIVFLKDELAEDRSKEFLRNEVAHFIDEENFFGEQSFISNGLNRKDNSKGLAALALKKDASAEIPSTTTTPSTVPNATPTATPTTTPTPSADVPTTTPAAAIQTTSISTSFQQPQELNMFKTLLNQIQESIRDTNPKQNVKNKNDLVAKTNTRSKKENLTPTQQSLEISEKILNDLNVLHDNLNQKIQEIE